MNWIQLISFLLLISTALTAFNTVIKLPQCRFMADPGPCDAQIRVFGYDYITNRCVHFYYGGCGGNPNRFATRKECMDTCYVENADGQDHLEDAKFDLFYKDDL